jgi:hypothetical protein
LPSTRTPGIAYPSARRTSSWTGVVLASGEYSPYRLFSQTKIVGSFQIAARFIASWNAPMFVVPSPKKQSETSSLPV